MRSAIFAALVLPPATAGCIFSGDVRPMYPESVPREVVDLARETMSGGGFVLELGQDGTLLGAEAEIPVFSIPEACAREADRRAPGGTLVYGGKVRISGDTVFRVVKEVDGRRVEMLLAPSGFLVGTRTALRPEDVPADVVESARRAADGGDLVVVEKVTGCEARGLPAFEVSLRVDDEILRVGVREDRSVVGVVRRVGTELAVPR
jgi:hypothetical protein